MKFLTSLGRVIAFGIRWSLALCLATTTFITSGIYFPGTLRSIQDGASNLIDNGGNYFEVADKFMVWVKPLNLDSVLVFGLYLLIAHIILKLIWMICNPFNWRKAEQDN